MSGDRNRGGHGDRDGHGNRGGDGDGDGDGFSTKGQSNLGMSERVHRLFSLTPCTFLPLHNGDGNGDEDGKT